MADEQKQESGKELASGATPHELPEGAKKALAFLAAPTVAVGKKVLETSYNLGVSMAQECKD